MIALYDIMIQILQKGVSIIFEYFPYYLNEYQQNYPKIKFTEP